MKKVLALAVFILLVGAPYFCFAGGRAHHHHSQRSYNSAGCCDTGSRGYWSGSNSVGDQSSVENRGSHSRVGRSNHDSRLSDKSGDQGHKNWSDKSGKFGDRDNKSLSNRMDKFGDRGQKDHWADKSGKFGDRDHKSLSNGMNKFGDRGQKDHWADRSRDRGNHSWDKFGDRGRNGFLSRDFGDKYGHWDRGDHRFGDREGRFSMASFRHGFGHQGDRLDRIAGHMARGGLDRWARRLKHHRHGHHGWWERMKHRGDGFDQFGEKTDKKDYARSGEKTDLAGASADKSAQKSDNKGGRNGNVGNKRDKTDSQQTAQAPGQTTDNSASAATGTQGKNQQRSSSWQSGTQGQELSRLSSWTTAENTNSSAQ